LTVRATFRASQKDLLVINVTVLMVVLAALLLPASAAANHSYLTSSGTAHHWPAAIDQRTAVTQISWTLKGTYASTWQAYLERAEEAWDTRTYYWDSYLDPWLSVDPYTCEFRQGIIHVCNGSYGSNWAGLAEWYYDDSTGHILYGRNRLNDDASGINQGGGTCWSGFGYMPCQDYAKGVVCQELGHTLGLDHADDTSCMGLGYYASAHGVTDPDGTDVWEVDVNHNHIDAESSTSSSPSSSASKSTSPRGNGRTLVPPAKGNCQPKQIDEHLTIQRACKEYGPQSDIIKATVVH
jgi:hypothetical protein